MRLKLRSYREKCFCAFCKSPRWKFNSRHVTVVHMVASLAGALLLSYLIWQDFDPRCFAFIGLGLGVAEIFTQIRWRLSIPCRVCGFDSILYLQDSRLAVKKVKAKLYARGLDPLILFRKNPTLNIPKRRITRMDTIRAEALGLQKVATDRAQISAAAKAAAAKLNAQPAKPLLER